MANKTMTDQGPLGSTSEGYPVPDIVTPKIDRNSVQVKETAAGYTNIMPVPPVPNPPKTR